MTPRLELEGTWEEILAHAATLAGRRVRVTVLPPPADAAPDTQPPAEARDAERVARVKGVRGKFARPGMTRASERLHEERQIDKAKEEPIAREDRR